MNPEINSTGRRFDLISQFEKRLPVSTVDVEQLLRIAQQNGLIITSSKLPSRVGVNAQGEIEMNLNPNATAGDAIHELIHVDQSEQAIASGVSPDHLSKDTNVVNRALAEIQAIEIEMKFVQSQPQQGQLAAVKMHRDFWVKELEKAGYELPEKISNPLSPQIIESLKPLKK